MSLKNSDKLHEECGVFGIYTAPEDTHSPAAETFSALYALQHRGQESCGIGVLKGGTITLKKGRGLLSEVFDDKLLASMTGNAAVGHVRYSTSAEISSINAQPIVIKHVNGSLAVALNGSLVNSAQLKWEAELHGGIFQTTSDAEIIASLIVRQRLSTSTLEEAILGAMRYMTGAYSLVIMSGKKLIALRDPNGYRPLCMGRLGSSYVFASESCAFDAIGAEFIRDVAPGEVITVDDGGIKSIDSGIKARPALCIFEYVYFARPDSVIDGVSVDLARQMAGRCLARTDKIRADIVVGVPDSGLSAAMGYSIESGIPYANGFIKNRYIARTFIQPTQGQRERAVKVKLNALASVVSGKSVIMVDDSIVRGTTSARTVSILREAGAREVHMRISSPPFLYPCYFGTDIPDQSELIAFDKSVDEVAEVLGVDSLMYLKLQDVKKMAEGIKYGFCDACFTGDYAVNINESFNRSEPPGGIDE